MSDRLKELGVGSSGLISRAGIWTIPNIISMYRQAALPVIVWALASGHRRLFAGLVVANLISDILDGILARMLQQETELGARLDSYGDIATYVLAVAGLFAFHRQFIAHHRIGVLLLVGFYLLVELVSLIRFRRLVSMHLYSSKAAGCASCFSPVILPP